MYEHKNLQSLKKEAAVPRFFMKDVSFSYETNTILHQIGFSIRQTDALVGLIGANGSGKTTLLRAICNELPHSGSCFLDGQPLEDLSTRELARKISYIPQRSGIHISMPVLDVVLMGCNPQLRLLEHPSKTMIANAASALETVGIAHLQNKDYLTLSEGEKQLCILARTLVEETKLLLLDEPDSALDFHNKYCMMKILKQLISNYHKTALLCLHDPVLALTCCDQLILLKDGKVLDILFPETDSVADMESAFSKLYGPVSLKELKDQSGGRRLVLISDIL